MNSLMSIGGPVLGLRCHFLTSIFLFVTDDSFATMPAGQYTGDDAASPDRDCVLVVRFQTPPSWGAGPALTPRHTWHQFLWFRRGQ